MHARSSPPRIPPRRRRGQRCWRRCARWRGRSRCQYCSRTCGAASSACYRRVSPPLSPPPPKAGGPCPRREKPAGRGGGAGVRQGARGHAVAAARAPRAATPRALAGRRRRRPLCRRRCPGALPRPRSALATVRRSRPRDGPSPKDFAFGDDSLSVDARPLSYRIPNPAVLLTLARAPILVPHCLHPNLSSLMSDV